MIRRESNNVEGCKLELNKAIERLQLQRLFSVKINRAVIYEHIRVGAFNTEFRVIEEIIYD